MTALSARALSDLRAALGTGHIVTDPEVLSGRSVDWTGRYRGHTPALVRPGDAADVASVIEIARRHGLALVPQGGNTGLVGGSVPQAGEVLLGLDRLNSIHHVDPQSGRIVADAGVTIAAVQQAAREAGWAYGVDLAARGSATVGGTIATNAGGIHVLRHGATRNQVMGVEAVFGNGSRVRRLAGLIKDNTGYALSSLLCGSEGTLGVVTQASLRLVPEYRFRTTALIAYDSIADAVEAGLGLPHRLDCLDAVELIVADGIALVTDVFRLSLPFAEVPSACLVVEAAAHRDVGADLAAALDSGPGVVDVAVATDAARRAALWRFREAHTEAVNTLGAPHKLDVTLPASRLTEFIEEVPRLVREAVPEAATWRFGHVADGNVHVNVTGVADDDLRADDAVLRAVVDRGGSISAEHGIGTAKKRWFSESIDAAELAAMRAVKDACDPDRVLNPAVLL